MKKILLFILLCEYFSLYGQITPPEKDKPFLENPYIITEIYIGHPNCRMMYIFEGSKRNGDILYYTTPNNSGELVKISLPEHLAKKKNLVFLFKSETGVAFAEKRGVKKWSTLYLPNMSWLSPQKTHGHDGEDKL
jgi:hypothetical protein